MKAGGRGVRRLKMQGAQGVGARSRAGSRRGFSSAPLSLSAGLTSCATRWGCRASRFVAVATGIVLRAASASAQNAAPTPPADEDCVTCHDAAATRANGASMALDQKALIASTHGPLACVNCHANLAKLTEFPHGQKLAR